ncbi:chaplin [Streptomyces sp. NPDC047987]|uniref:chaplin n=1 Tax=unclassified Streptomyces TaxID=2593676 RepID=UPI00342C520B
MRKSLSKSVLVMAAASGILAATGGNAFADASVEASAVGSPGVGSGNAVQAPVHAPVGLCGNTVNAIGLLNPAFGNECQSEGGQESGTAGQRASAEGVTAGSAGVLSGNSVQAPVDVPINVCGNTVDVGGVLSPAVGNECGNESGNVTTPVDPPVDTPHKPPVDTPHKPPVDTPHKPPVDTPHKPPAHQPHKPPVVHHHHHHHHHDCPPGHHHNPPKPPTHHWQHKPVHHKPHWQHHHKPQLARTGSDTNLGLAGGASAAMVLGGALLVRRTRASKG